MKVGDQIANRWITTEKLPSESTVLRFRAKEIDTGTLVEVLALQPSVVEASSKARFIDLHTELVGQANPSIVRTLMMSSADPVCVVRAPLEPYTLADVSGPLKPDEVATIGALLLPAILDASSATGGALLSNDVGINSEGSPVLAPWGRPLNTVTLNTELAVAPETRTGSIPKGETGLYGLGILLYRLATGEKARPQVPPSSVRPQLPAELNNAIVLLLSADVSKRGSALAPLRALAKPSIDLRQHVQKRSVSNEVKFTVGTPKEVKHVEASEREDRDPSNFVILSAEKFEGLSSEQKATAIGLAKISTSTAKSLVSQKYPLVLAEMNSRSAAEQKAASIQRSTRLPVTVPVHSSGAAPWMSLGVGLGTSFLLFAVGTLLGFLGLGLLSGALMATSALGVFATVLFVGYLTFNPTSSDSVHALTEAALAREQQTAGGLLAPNWEKLASLRSQLPALNLSEAMSLDVRDALLEVEQSLIALADRAALAVDASHSTDIDELHDRYDVLHNNSSTEKHQALSEAMHTESSNVFEVLSDLSAALQATTHTEDDQTYREVAAASKRAKQLGSL